MWRTSACGCRLPADLPIRWRADLQGMAARLGQAIAHTRPVTPWTAPLDAPPKLEASVTFDWRTAWRRHRVVVDVERRADVDVTLLVKGEVLAREGEVL